MLCKQSVFTDEDLLTLACCSLEQCSPALGLMAHCPAYFRCFPALTFLIQAIAVQQVPVNQPSIGISWVEARKLLKRAGQCALRKIESNVTAMVEFCDSNKTKTLFC